MNGKVITVNGLVDPAELGMVMMHEHLHSDIYDWDTGSLIEEEKPITPERRAYLLKEAVPHLKACGKHGCHAYVDVSMAPWRAWPSFYREISHASGMHIILATGFYREVETRAFAQLALHPDLTTHHRGQLLADRQPQPGAAVSTTGGVVGLDEGLEQFVLLLRRHADTAIADL